MSKFALSVYISLTALLCISTFANAQSNDDEEEYVDSLISILNSLPDNEDKLLVLNDIAENHSNVDSTLKYATIELELAKKRGDRTHEMKANLYISWSHSYMEDYRQSVDYGQRCITIAKELGDSAFLIKGYEMSANAFSMMMMGPQAIDYYTEALSIAEKTNNKNTQVYLLMSLGQENADNYLYDEAIEFHTKARQIAEGENHTKAVVLCDIRLANDYMVKAEKSKDDTLSLKLAEERIKTAYDNTSNVYEDVPQTYCEVFLRKIKRGKLTKEDAGKEKNFFLDLVQKGAEYSISVGAYHQAFIDKLCESEIHTAFGEYKQAEAILDSLRLTVDILDTDDSNAHDLCTSYIELYSANHNYKKLSEYQDILIEHLTNSNKVEYAAKAGYAMSELDNEKINREREIESAKREAKLESNARWRSIVILLLLAVGVLIMRGYVRSRKSNRRLNEQNNILIEQQEEISSQNESLENQKSIIEAQNIHLLSQNEVITKTNKEMVDSMNFAQLIQTAAMPTQAQMNALWGDSLILLRALKIVSGDFYWTTSVNGYRMLAVADCTGHGVPGAFLSMLGISILNEVSVSVESLGGSAGEMLDKMNAAFRQSLQKRSTGKDMMNGIDIALIVAEPNGHTIHYAGAYRPLIIMRGSNMMKYDANKTSIGSSADNKTFVDNVIECQRGDTLYMFSDGLTDQFGYNEKNETKKLGRKTLLRWIEDMTSLPLSAQKSKLDILIDNWRTGIGDRRCEQTDDMVIVGIRI